MLSLTRTTIWPVLPACPANNLRPHTPRQTRSPVPRATLHALLSDEPDHLAVSSSSSQTLQRSDAHLSLSPPSCGQSSPPFMVLMPSPRSMAALCAPVACPRVLAAARPPAPLKRGLLQSTSCFHAWHVPRPRCTFITWINSSGGRRHHDLPGFAG